MDSYFYFVTVKTQNKLYGGATTNYKKKIKVRGFTYFTYKTVKFYNITGTRPSLGFVFGMFMN
jgi:predicted GIY-YIG superfamily endonuclease